VVRTVLARDALPLPADPKQSFYFAETAVAVGIGAVRQAAAIIVLAIPAFLLYATASDAFRPTVAAGPSFAIRIIAIDPKVAIVVVAIGACPLNASFVYADRTVRTRLSIT
jgi:hypothetical protein